MPLNTEHLADGKSNWFSAVRQQVITWASVDLDLYRCMGSQAPNIYCETIIWVFSYIRFRCSSNFLNLIGILNQKFDTKYQFLCEFDAWF